MVKVKIVLNDIEDVKGFVATMNKCAYPTTLKANKYVVDAKSIMGVFSLNLVEPVALEIEADREQVENIVNGIDKYIVKE